MKLPWLRRNLKVTTTTAVSWYPWIVIFFQMFIIIILLSRLQPKLNGFYFSAHNVSSVNNEKLDANFRYGKLVFVLTVFVAVKG